MIGTERSRLGIRGPEAGTARCVQQVKQRLSHLDHRDGVGKCQELQWWEKGESPQYVWGL